MGAENSGFYMKNRNISTVELEHPKTFSSVVNKSYFGSELELQHLNCNPGICRTSQNMNFEEYAVLQGKQVDFERI